MREMRSRCVFKLPFGEELAGGTTQNPGPGGRTDVQGYAGDSVRQKFTLKERDSETVLDYFLARYYSSNQGRFTSVDPHNAGCNLDRPERWNGYAYAANNPFRYIDPNGMDVQVLWEGKSSRWYTESQFKQFVGDMRSQGFIVSHGAIYALQFDDDGDPVGLRQIGTYSSDMNLLGQGVSAELARRNPAFQDFGWKGLLYLSLFAAPPIEGAPMVGWLSRGLAESGAPVGVAATESLIASAGAWTTLKNGAQQGWAKGNPQEIFNAIIKGATKTPGGAYRLANGTHVQLYPSTTSGVATIFIDTAEQIYKIRITP
jgi:RHS repeat-associated protein